VGEWCLDQSNERSDRLWVKSRMFNTDHWDDIGIIELKNNLDIKRSLLIFNKIISKGECDNGRCILQGMTAWYDFDGYTCYLGFNEVTLTLLFHGKYHIDSPSKDSLTAFEKKLSQFN
jgi:hypothetical protein